jgi:SAM-dependent MidA family methyltransferase
MKRPEHRLVQRKAAVAAPTPASICHVSTESNGPATPGYRREALPDPEAVGEDEALAEAIRDEIRREGPITFARFMERALYEPGHGYYRRAEPGPGRAGDFLTAPEAHPIFGAAVGRLVAQAWDALGRPAPFTITEPGAGTGALAAGLLGGLRDDASPLLDALRYRPVEVESARLDALRGRLAIEGLADHLVDDVHESQEAEAGAVVANEVLDALPVHRVVGRPGGLRELLVGLDELGAFAWVEAEPTTTALAARLESEAITLPDGQITEVCLALDGWLGLATGHVARGVAILIDYAVEPPALHGPGRPTGTLRAFARHAVSGDPFRHVGRQDLTATVDLWAVRRAAGLAGLTPVGETTAAELLAAAGDDLPGRYAQGPGATLQDALTLRSSLARLLDPRGLGGFRVLVFGRGLPPGTELGALRRFARR